MKNKIIDGFFQQTKYYFGLIALLVIGALFSPLDSEGGNIFLSGSNLSDVFRQVSNIGIISIGMTLVIIAGGIDLSVGAMVSLGSVLAAILLTEPGWNSAASFSALASSLTLFAIVFSLLKLKFFKTSPSSSAFSKIWPVGIAFCTVAAFAGLITFQLPGKMSLWLVLFVVPLTGAAVGAINGFVITRGNIQPFIATLASMVAILGTAKLISGQDAAVRAIYSSNSSKNIELLRALLFDILPVPALFFLAVSLIFGFILSRTIYGKHLYAIGGNERCARLSGLHVDRSKLITYAISGFLSALVGILFAAQFRQGKADAGQGWELDAIAAVVIGGSALTGGVGRISGTVAGVLIFGFLGNILLLNNIDSNTQLLLKGIIILVAVFLQQTPLSKLRLWKAKP